jgi:hypothetical protein
MKIETALCLSTYLSIYLSQKHTHTHTNTHTNTNNQSKERKKNQRNPTEGRDVTWGWEVRRGRRKRGGKEYLASPNFVSKSRG